MDKDQNLAHGIKWGLIGGIIYCIILTIRYKLLAVSPVYFFMMYMVGYIIMMVLLLLCGLKRKKELGGFIELKDAFQTMFVCLLIFELFFSIYDFLYVKLIDPDFYQHFKDASEKVMLQSGQPQAKIDEVLDKIDVDAGRKMNGFDMAKTYLVSVGITGVVAFIFALIIKKKRDPFNNTTDNFIQAV